MAELAGQLLGDATESLTPLEVGGASRRILLVACDKLIRVDFSAAGSILNWAAALQAAGCQVVFCNVHRLIAVFFNVIGINEHARVLPRQD
jgi:anti-anti-sigma regulatory factor